MTQPFKDIQLNVPTKPGMYIVRTKTKYGRINYLFTSAYIDKDGGIHFGVNNQKVTHWMEEPNI